MIDHPQEPTIAAIATPPGPGGIGVIRISGSLARPLLVSIFHPKNKNKKLRSHQLTYGFIRDPQTGSMLDEVLAVYMQGPKTYTREDVVEIHCHGSYLVLKGVLALLLKEGAQLAAPGEFTKRAFLNGRIDLTRAEAVMELLEANTPARVDMARNQLGGGLHATIMAIRNQLMVCRGIIEVAIDFPDEDVEIINPQAMSVQINENVLAPLATLINDADKGRIYRDGISVVILGRPNVGKSSLLNSLLREERAIVTPVPGTTRDTIEEMLTIHGMPVRIVDTAGIRDQAEAVEEIGIERARAKLGEADLVLFLLDATCGITPDDEKLRKALPAKPVLYVVNKIDIVEDYKVDVFQEKLAGQPVVSISAKKGDYIDTLEQAVYDLVCGGEEWDPGHGVVPNVRHRAALEKAREAGCRVLDGIAEGLPADLVAIELQATLDHLGDIIGETTTEDVLDMIFQQFCLGK
ncbi:MAG: tRNA uridine-5-carboxymethylaminomethyl(34) synthesis GTPase MnmE [Proteobacteria bacterium]|nr:tRNA uridine-5-carboxymethylaminomethyl(34) synthesis GTPase MnmE [Pseudomonadota bacterium]MBU1639820.1 tRNA uridine-5-carboxymethylaminomethyl(34) synthesis GTPase MnmE [Pseudomonadota bacterium]